MYFRVYKVCWRITYVLRRCRYRQETGAVMRTPAGQPRVAEEGRETQRPSGSVNTPSRSFLSTSENQSVDSLNSVAFKTHVPQDAGKREYEKMIHSRFGFRLYWGQIMPCSVPPTPERDTWKWRDLSCRIDCGTLLAFRAWDGESLK